ncbi:hypothetical protein ACOXXX_02005 [Thalassococcus sp. BH17M4-6]|uniref:hypothetical protein n=1 Tax=Thalassococcus sp. BH17M4-6 TaxID=3413148 RepID=UPI003BC5E648
MTTSKLSLLSLTLATAPALAFAASHAEMDTSGDGMLSVEEVQAALPEVSTDMFMEMDTDGDGLLSEEEVAAATDAGMLPMSDG